MLFHAFCYIVAILLVLWLRSESKPHQSDVEQAVQKYFEQPEMVNEAPQSQPSLEAIAPDIWQEEITTSSPQYWVRQSQLVKPVLELMPAKEIPTPKITKKSAATVKPPKAHSKKLSQKPQPISVGAAAIDYTKMSVEQLRKECTLQKINWRTGGDYGKPMKKGQMLAALN